MSLIIDWFKRVFPRKEECEPDPGIDALLTVIRIVAKVGRGVAILHTGVAALPMLIALGGSAVPDIIKLIQEYEDIPCELSALNGESYALLLKAVMDEFKLSIPEAKSTIATAIDLVADLKNTPMN